ncbi:MAG TPA: VUT family protein [Gemmatimonadales bacterium]
MLVILAYLGSVVAANLLTAIFGKIGSIVTAFALIGATITLRDRLHDRWEGRGLTWRLGALILTGGVLSWLVNRDAAVIAMASMTAFVASETTDTIVYQLLRHLPWLRRVNGSNLASSAVDSLVFPTLAFGGFDAVQTTAEFVAKVLGGAAWAVGMLWWKKARV